MEPGFICCLLDAARKEGLLGPEMYSVTVFTKKKKKTVISAEKFKIIGKRSFFFLAAVARLGIRLWVLETSLIVTDGIKVKLTYIQFRTFYGF